MAHKHMLELLTEGQYATVAVYFETEAQDRQPTPQKPVPQPKRFGGEWGVNPDKQFPFLPDHLPARTYTYKVSHELAKELKNGDFIVVPGLRLEDTYRVGKVWQVHAAPQIDFDADYAYKWVVQKLDTTAYNAHLAREAQFAEMLREVEKAKQREAIRNAVMNNVQPGTEAYAIFQSAIQLIGGNVAPAPAQTAPQALEPGQPMQNVPWAAQPAPAPTRSQFAPPKFGA